MICGFGITFGEHSTTYTTDRYIQGIPAELVAIGECMAADDYIANGPLPCGYDHVKVSILREN